MLKASLDHINMSVKDLNQSVEWYNKIFDFKKVEEGVSSDGPWAILKSENSMLCLYQEASSKLNQNEANLRIYHFGLKISDKDLWNKKIIDYKVKILYGGEVRYPHSVSWYLIDPSGYEIEVSYWDQDEICF